MLSFICFMIKEMMLKLKFRDKRKPMLQLKRTLLELNYLFNRHTLIDVSRLDWNLWEIIKKVIWGLEVGGLSEEFESTIFLR